VIFTPLPLAGAWLVEQEPRTDVRGFFARTWCAREYEAHGLETRIAQTSVSYSARRGTLRGMHYQVAPDEEVKLVHCLRGAIYDVIIDLRPDSPTYCRHLAIELTERNRLTLYVPRGFAHGFQTLVDDTEVFYQMSAFYAPEQSRGVRWNDPAFSIEWPIAPPFLLERDDRFPDFVLSGSLTCPSR
jgi:dTDP-4-dehydrorhamnose 3,5-epimerase